MGWSGGTIAMSAVIRSVNDAGISSVEKRKDIYRPILEALTDMDWDTLDECLNEDEAYDELFREFYGDDIYDDDEGNIEDES